MSSNASLIVGVVNLKWDAAALSAPAWVLKGSGYVLDTLTTQDAWP